jgi:hypothetical protein
MTTIIINEKTKKGRILLDLIREMNCGKIIEDAKIVDEIPNDITRLAIKQARKGETIKCADFDDYIAKVR